MFDWFINNSNKWKYQELDTPIKDEDYHKIAEDTYEQIMNWTSDDKKGWKNIFDQNDVLMEEYDIPNSNINLLRTTLVLQNVDIKKLSQISHNIEEKYIKQIYSDVISHEIIKEISGDLHICHTKFKTPTGVSNRDMVAIRYRKELNNNKVIHISKSINCENIHFSNNFIRMCYMSSLLLEPINNDDGSMNVKVISVDHIDPKGWIPKIIMNIIKVKIGKKLTNIKKLYKYINEQKN